jgi:hypothetical protein
LIRHVFGMIIKHARNILRDNRRRRGTYNRYYLSFTTGRRENGLLDFGDLALPLLLEAGEKFLKFPHFLSLHAFFGGLTVCFERLALLFWDLLQSHHDGILRIKLERHD